MSELQTLESIIKRKPEGATHFQDCDGNCYFQSDAFGMTDLYNNEPVKYENIVNIRSLSDIQKQIDQLKEIEQIKASFTCMMIDGMMKDIDDLREQLDAWAEKYADLKIKSDANKWAHDNMQEQLAKELNLKDSWRAVAHKLEQDKLDLKYALASAKAMEEKFNELKSIVLKCQPDNVCIGNALAYLRQLEGKDNN